MCNTRWDDLVRQYHGIVLKVLDSLLKCMLKETYQHGHMYKLLVVRMKGPQKQRRALQQVLRQTLHSYYDSNIF